MWCLRNWESVHPAPGANTKTGRRGSFRPPSVAVLVPRAPVTAAPSIEVIRPATASDSNSTPQLFYATREIDAHFLKGPEPTKNPKPTVYNAPAQPKRGIKHAVVKQATFELDGFTHSGGSRTSEPLE